jgi:hypothetical protein
MAWLLHIFLIAGWRRLRPKLIQVRKFVEHHLTDSLLDETQKIRKMDVADDTARGRILPLMVTQHWFRRRQAVTTHRSDASQLESGLPVLYDPHANPKEWCAAYGGGVALPKLHNRVRYLLATLFDDDAYVDFLQMLKPVSNTNEKRATYVVPTSFADMFLASHSRSDLATHVTKIVVRSKGSEDAVLCDSSIYLSKLPDLYLQLLPKDAVITLYTDLPCDATNLGVVFRKFGKALGETFRKEHDNKTWHDLSNQCIYNPKPAHPNIFVDGNSVTIYNGQKPVVENDVNYAPVIRSHPGAFRLTSGYECTLQPLAGEPNALCDALFTDASMATPRNPERVKQLAQEVLQLLMEKLQ